MMDTHHFPMPLITMHQTRKLSNSHGSDSSNSSNSSNGSNGSNVRLESDENVYLVYVSNNQNQTQRIDLSDMSQIQGIFTDRSQAKDFTIKVHNQFSISGNRESISILVSHKKGKNPGLGKLEAIDSIYIKDCMSRLKNEGAIKVDQVNWKNYVKDKNNRILKISFFNCRIC